MTLAVLSFLLVSLAQAQPIDVSFDQGVDAGAVFKTVREQQPSACYTAPLKEAVQVSAAKPQVQASGLFNRCQNMGLENNQCLYVCMDGRRILMPLPPDMEQMGSRACLQFIEAPPRLLAKTSKKKKPVERDTRDSGSPDNTDDLDELGNPRRDDDRSGPDDVYDEWGGRGGSDNDVLFVAGNGLMRAESAKAAQTPEQCKQRCVDGFKVSTDVCYEMFDNPAGLRPCLQQAGFAYSVCLKGCEQAPKS